MNAFDDLLAAKDARKRLTKRQLLEEFDQADDAWINLQSERDMAEAYYRALQTHLRAHGCTHDFADVAETPESVA